MLGEGRVARRQLAPEKLDPPLPWPTAAPCLSFPTAGAALTPCALGSRSPGWAYGEGGFAPPGWGMHGLPEQRCRGGRVSEPWHCGAAPHMATVAHTRVPMATHTRAHLHPPPHPPPPPPHGIAITTTRGHIHPTRGHPWARSHRHPRPRTHPRTLAEPGVPAGRRSRRQRAHGKTLACPRSPAASHTTHPQPPPAPRRWGATRPPSWVSP